MIQFLEVDGIQYPFKFGVREFYTFSNAVGIEHIDDVGQKISMDFDAFLDLFHLASKKGVRRYAEEEGETVDQYAHLVLSTEKIENMIDDEPNRLFELQQLLEESTVIEKMNNGEVSKKKTV